MMLVGPKTDQNKSDCCFCGKCTKAVAAAAIEIDVLHAFPSECNLEVGEASVESRHHWHGYHCSCSCFCHHVLMKVDLPPELEVEEEEGGGGLLRCCTTSSRLSTGIGLVLEIDLLIKD